MSFSEPNGAVVKANMKRLGWERIIEASSPRGLQGRSATNQNGQAANEEMSAIWREGWMPEKYFWRSGREKCFSLDIPSYRTSEWSTIRELPRVAA